MNLKLIKLQALLIGLLSLTLAAEWSYSKFAWRRLQQSLQSTHSDNAAPLELPAITTLKTAANTYSDMVDRPLFIQGRKPLPEETDSGDKPQNVEIGQIDDWLLIGVYSKNRKPAMALFAKKNEAKKYLKLRTDQMISGWQLKEIQPDRVILDQAGQQKSILLRKPRAEIKQPIQAKPTLPFPFPPKPNNPDPENANHDSETN